MRRVLALLAAAGMVAASLAIRARLDNDDPDDERSTLRLVCATELAEACRRLEQDADQPLAVTIEDAGFTAGRLSEPRATRTTSLDGWLVPRPWPQIVLGARSAAGLDPGLARPGAPVARSPLVLAMFRDRAQALGPRCPGGVVGWRCLGERAANPEGWAAVGGEPTWGPIKPGHDQPDRTAAGLLVLGQAVAAYFEGTRPAAELSRADFEDDGFLAWLQGLERAIPSRVFDRSQGSPFEQMLVGGPAVLDAVGTTEAESGPLRARSAIGNQVVLLYPSPMATADVVLATVAGGRSAGRIRSLVTGSDGRRALARAGWRVPDEPRAQGIPAQPPLPPNDGLPDPGTLDALRTVWEEAIR